MSHSFPTRRSSDLRNAVAVVSSSDIKDQVLAHIAKHVDTVVPRKDHTGAKTLSLTVECSDPYGRQEVMGQVVPTRTAILLVSTEPISTTLTVLSASLSSKTRILQDKIAAMMIGRALDVKRKIPRNSRLEDLIDNSRLSLSLVLTSMPLPKPYSARAHATWKY